MFLFCTLLQDFESSESEVETWRRLQFCLIGSTHSWVCWCRSHVTDKRGSIDCSEQVQYFNNTSIRLFAVSIFSEGLRLSYSSKHKCSKVVWMERVWFLWIWHVYLAPVPSCPKPLHFSPLVIVTGKQTVHSPGGTPIKTDCTLPWGHSHIKKTGVLVVPFMG